jgi:hypothetical protein
LLLFTKHCENFENLALINIPEFKLASSYSRKDHIHGGSAIFVRDKLNFKCRHDILLLNSEINFEISAVEIVQAKTIYCCIYRSPNGNIDVFMEKMSALLEILQSEMKTCNIVGDFNLDSLNPSHFYNTLKDICNSYNFSNIINSPTRVQMNCATCIDHCYTNNIDNLNYVINKNSISDHYGIELYQSKLEIGEIENQLFRRKVLCPKLAQKIITLLEVVNWEILTYINGTDNKYEKFHSILLDSVNKIIPVTSIKKKKCKTVVTDNLTRELIEQVKLFEELHIQYPDNNIFLENLKETVSKSFNRVKVLTD